MKKIITWFDEVNKSLTNCKPLVKLIKLTTYPIVYLHECCHFYMAKLLGIKTEGIVMQKEVKNGLLSYVKGKYDSNLPNKTHLQKSLYLFKIAIIALAPILLSLLTFYLLHLNIIDIPSTFLLLGLGFMPSISDFRKGFVCLVASILFLFNTKSIKIEIIE